MTGRQLVYLVLDEIKSISDDSIFNEEHVFFLLGNYRAFLIKKEWEKDKNSLTESSYQEICLDLTYDEVEGECGEKMLKSVQKIPELLAESNTRVYPVNFSHGSDVIYVSRERFKYVSANKYTQNFIYTTLGPDNYLYLKSSNSQFEFLEKVRMSGLFEDYEAAAKLSCETDEDGNTICDVLDKTFKIETYLVPTLIELVVKELLGAEYRPKDNVNDAADNLADLVSFIRRNAKSGLQKQIEG